MLTNVKKEFPIKHVISIMRGWTCFLIGWLVLLSVTSGGGWGGPGGLVLHRPTHTHTAFHQAGDWGGGTCWRRGLGDESLDYAAGAVHSENEKRGLSQHTPGRLLIILLITCNVVVEGLDLIDGLSDETLQEQERLTKQLNIHIIKKGGVTLRTRGWKWITFS